MINALQLTPSLYLVGSGDIGLSEDHDCHIYLIDSGSDDWVLVDSGTGISSFALIDNIKAILPDSTLPSSLFLTHSHPDHAGGVADLQDAFKLEVYAGELTAKRVLEGDEIGTSLDFARQLGVYPSDYHLSPPKSIQPICENQTVQIGNMTLTPIETPGHSEDSISYMVEDNKSKILFSGDSLFSDNRLPLLNTFDSSLSDYRHTINKLASRNFDILCPGHGLFILKDASKIPFNLQETIKNSLYIPRVIEY